MVDELLRESSVAEEFIEEGRQEGITEGRVDEARRLARLVLQGRLPSLEPDMLAAIERADATTLEQVVVHAASETVEQIRSRLGLDRD